MRLPWVSPDLMSALVVQNENLIAHLEAQAKRYDTLLEKYHALKLQGAEAPPPVVTVTARQLQPIEPEDAELTALVAEQAGPDLRKRAIMLRQLKRDRLDGVAVEEIRRQIEQGIQAEGVPV